LRKGDNNIKNKRENAYFTEKHEGPCASKVIQKQVLQDLSQNKKQG